MKLQRDNRGSALLYVLLILTVGSILATGLMAVILNDTRHVTDEEWKAKDFYIADGVMELVKQGKNDEAQAFAPTAVIDTSDPNLIEVSYTGEKFRTVIQFDRTTRSYTVTQTLLDAEVTTE